MYLLEESHRGLSHVEGTKFGTDSVHIWRAWTLEHKFSSFLSHFFFQLVCPALKLGENRNLQTLKRTNQPDAMDSSFGNLNYK